MRHRQLRTGPIGTIVLALHLLAQAGQSQPDLPRVVPTIDHEEYDQVLDRLFPVVSTRGPDIVFTLSLRITPAFDPESQIDIVLRRGQKSTVQYSRVGQNIFSTCNKLLETTGEHQPRALAEKFRVNRKVLNVSPDQILRWQRELFAAVTSSLLPLPRMATEFLASGAAVVALDGDSFELWYAQFPTEFNIRFSESDLAKGASLIKWARSLHNDIVKLAATN